MVQNREGSFKEDHLLKTSDHSQKVAYLVVFLVFAIIPFIVESQYIIQVLILCGVNAILVISLGLILGLSGQLSLAQVGFFGVGAYTSALLACRLGISFWIGLPVATILSGIVGFLIGYPSLRLRGHYLAITTLAFLLILYQIFLNWVSLTRGAMCLVGVPPITFFGIRDTTRIPYYYLILVMTTVIIWVAVKISNSRVGRALKAIREDEVAAQSLGIKTHYYKVRIFTIGAAMAGAAGSFFAHYMGSVAPESFSLHPALNILMMAIIGGLGSIFGSILGAIAFTILPEYLRVFAQYRLLINGVIVILVISFFPGGLVEIFKKLQGWWVKLKPIRANG